MKCFFFNCHTFIIPIFHEMVLDPRVNYMYVGVFPVVRSSRAEKLVVGIGSVVDKYSTLSRYGIYSGVSISSISRRSCMACQKTFIKRSGRFNYIVHILYSVWDCMVLTLCVLQK
jgi:hypothetical protein